VLSHATMLRAYISTIVRDAGLVQDAFSEAAVEIIRAHERFDAARPFGPWARGVARRVALGMLKKEARQPILLDDRILEDLAENLTAEPVDEHALALQREALEQCLAEISPTHQQLIQQRYYERQSYAQISRATGRTVPALYIVFSRLHRNLCACVQGRMQQT